MADNTLTEAEAAELARRHPEITAILLDGGLPVQPPPGVVTVSQARALLAKPFAEQTFEFKFTPEGWLILNLTTRRDEAREMRDMCRKAYKSGKMRAIAHRLADAHDAAAGAYDLELQKLAQEIEQEARRNG